MTCHHAQLEQILPDKVCLAVVRGDVSSRLFPTEESAIANSVEERRREFMTVRHCARSALSDLGAPAVASPPGPDRAPQWPDGVVGSMTHCVGYRAAAVGWRSEELTSVGIDAEPNEPLPRNVLAFVSPVDEWRMLQGLASSCPGLAKRAPVIFLAMTLTIASSVKGQVARAWGSNIDDDETVWHVVRCGRCLLGCGGVRR